MHEIGYKLSSEEHGSTTLVENARRAEEVGFSFAMISDHFHPWIDHQGQSPFSVVGYWSDISGQREASNRTGVTCPTIRIHPAIVAQAAATCAQLVPRRSSSE